MPVPNIEQLISMIFTTSRMIRDRAKDREKIDPFSYLQLETLRYVAEKGNPSMKDIADYLCITPPSATSLINGLVKTKQLERVFDKDDRRLIRLAVTAKGRGTLEDGFKKITRRMQAVLSKLNEKERSDLIKILEKLSRAYNK